MQLTAEHPVFAGKTWAQVDASARKIRSQKKLIEGCGGIKLFEEGLSLVFSPQRFLLAETKFYQVRGQRWTPNPEMACAFFPFRLDRQIGDIVPITGGIYIGEKKLESRELEKVGLIEVKGEGKESIHFPFLCPKGSRLIMDLNPRQIPIFGRAEIRENKLAIYLAGDNPFLINNLSDLSLYLDILLNILPETNPDSANLKQPGIEKLLSIQSLTQKVCKQIWEISSQAEPAGLPLEVFKSRFFPAISTLTLNWFLRKMGYAYLFPSCSLQFKGGGGHYLGRVRLKNDSLKAGEEILLSGRTVSLLGRAADFVGYPGLFNKFGIFLDQIHQPPPASPDPVGGMIKTDTEAVKRDLLLLKNGAALAGFSLAHIKLLEEKSIQDKLGLKSYRSGDLYVLARAAGRDTRRLFYLTDQQIYKYYIEESYSPDFESGRERHLTDLISNLGKNIRAILLSQIGIREKILNGQSKRPLTAGNLDPQGQIYDSSELSIEAGDKEMMSLIYYWLEDLFEIVESAGLTPLDFIKNGEKIKLLFEIITKLECETTGEYLAELQNSPSNLVPAYLTVTILENWKWAQNPQ